MILPLQCWAVRTASIFFGLEYYIIGGVIETCERAGEKRVVERRKPIPVSEAVAAVVAHPLKKTK